ncbi:hypothetical protein EHS25_003247 [Saitozyma podzolica]|uniref:CID domain-containing protein n=1 Tax=Saitozyma podzolica TaxID=1890683 RepID=A0A427Y8B5_9TREE|nr:hypothetical protein EHS25_003247 [Saitozyma podzolica]
MWRGGQQPPRQAYPSAPGPGGGPGGYYAPPQPPTSAPAFQAQLQPQPQPPVDPFRSYYADRLRQLTFNSRPLIQELSVLAMQQRDAQHWPNMQSIVEEIEAAVLRSAPPEKLPKLYLIDSISKNIGAPYTTHLLPPIMPRLYARTYRDVDGVTKSKMEEMVGLWRTSAPDGGDLYGSNVREAVERDIFGSAGYQRVAAPSREKVLATMRAALEYHHRESVARPWDNAAQQNLAVLMQLNEMLNTRQLPPMELQQIMDKLQAMAPKPSQPPASQPTPPSFSPANPIAPPTPNLPPFPPNLPRQGGLTPVIPAVPTPPQSVSTPVPPPAVSAPNPSSLANASVPSLSAPGLPENFADLLRNLNNSGALSQPRTPEIPPAVLPTKSRLQDYEDMILSLDVQLGALDVNRMDSIPLGHLPERCPQCFMRFPEGGDKLRDHMDWHYRRNKQERQSGRGAHRRWLPRAEEWVTDFANSEAGPSKSPTKAQTEKDIASSKIAGEALQNRWVKVPSDPAKAARPCPICKEPFKSEWSDEEETWIWKNAVEVDGKIYHATCRQAMLNARRLAKIKTADGTRSLSKSKSPGLTPQPQSDVKPTLTADLGAAYEQSQLQAKRKAEQEGEEAEAEAKRVKVEEGVGGEGAEANGGADIGAQVQEEAGQGEELSGVQDQQAAEDEVKVEEDVGV